LEQADYLAEVFSIAAIACYPWISGAKLVGIDVAELPAVSSWVERMKPLPAVERAVAAILEENRGIYVQARAGLTPEQWSNLFGERMPRRGRDSDLDARRRGGAMSPTEGQTIRRPCVRI
jgi:hypothetical protein